MADIEVVIKIPEEIYERFGYEYREECAISKYATDIILDAFCNNTPLPKGHGRLIDADEIHYCHVDGTDYALKEEILSVPTIIEADKESKE